MRSHSSTLANDRTRAQDSRTEKRRGQEESSRPRRAHAGRQSEPRKSGSDDTALLASAWRALVDQGFWYRPGYIPC